MATLDFCKLDSLLREAMAGDVPALNDLMGQLRTYMHSRVREMLRASPHGEIDRSAIVQSVCRRLHENFFELDALNAPRLLLWIKKVVKNRILTEFRRPLIHQLGFDIVLADPTPNGASERRAELAAQVASALEKLPPCERRVVETRWFDGQSDQDTAQELNITTNHVHQLRFRALQKLRGLLHHLAEA